MDRFVADKSAHSDASAEDSPLDVSRRGLLIGAGAAAILSAQATSAAAQMGGPPAPAGAVPRVPPDH